MSSATGSVGYFAGRRAPLFIPAIPDDAPSRRSAMWFCMARIFRSSPPALSCRAVWLFRPLTAWSSRPIDSQPVDHDRGRQRNAPGEAHMAHDPRRQARFPEPIRRSVRVARDPGAIRNQARRRDRNPPSLRWGEIDCLSISRPRSEITAEQIWAGCSQSERPSYLTGNYVVMERHETLGLLPTQQIHPFLGSAMT